MAQTSHDYATLPRFAQLSVARAAPDQTVGTGATGPVDPKNYPLGFAVPAQVPQQAMVANQYGGGGGGGSRQQTPYMPSAAPPVLPPAAMVRAQTTTTSPSPQDYSMMAPPPQAPAMTQPVGYAMGSASPQQQAHHKPVAAQPQPQQALPPTANSGDGGLGISARDLAQQAELRVRSKVSLEEAMRERAKTRNYHFNFYFSLASAAADPKEVQAMFGENAAEAFQIRDPQSKQKVGVLENGIILGIDVLHTFSDCKVPLGVKIPGVRGNSYLHSGGRYPLIVYMGARDYGKEGRCIHRLTEHLNMRRLARFGHLTMKKIEETIKPSEIEPDWSYVEIDSPIMEIIQMNTDYLQVDTARIMRAVKNRHVFVDNALIQEVKDFIKKELFDVSPFTDLTQFGLSLKRADNQPWNSAYGIEMFNQRNDTVTTDWLTKQNHVSIELAITYLLHSKGSAAQIVVEKAAAAATNVNK